MSFLFSGKLIIVFGLVAVLGVIGATLIAGQKATNKTSDVRSSSLTSSQKVVLSLDPSSGTKSVGESFDAIVYLDSGSYDVSFVDLKLNFDKNVLALQSFTPSKTFNVTILNNPPSSNQDSFRFVLGNNSKDKIQGKNINIGVLHFKGKSAGQAKLDLNSQEITVRTSPPADASAVSGKANYVIAK